MAILSHHDLLAIDDIDAGGKALEALGVLRTNCPVREKMSQALPPKRVSAETPSMAVEGVMVSFPLVREQTSMYITRALSSSLFCKNWSPLERIFSDAHPLTWRMRGVYLLWLEASDVSEWISSMRTSSVLPI